MSMAEEFLAKLSELAEDLGLEDDEKSDFIDGSMKRRGFKPVTSWTDPEPENDKGSGDFFSRKREDKSGDGKTRSGANWQYGKSS